MVMALYQEFKNLLQTLKFCDRIKQYFIIKKIASSIQYCTREDLQGLLDFINTTHDVELQVKLFSILSVYLLDNDTYIDIFITYNPMYDAIDRILSKKLPRKTTVVLHFLTILLKTDAIDYTSRRNSLYLHAQNQIRASGCLASIADIFTSCMTYQDTWRALCRCLADACNNSEQNQNYCTHLIPKCIKRCNQRNMETFSVLQSLIYNNKRNVQLFLECDGMSLFNRELLQYESSLQLLSAIVQTSTEATIIAQNKCILNDVHELLSLCGPYTPTGQWATVILYYADTKNKGYEKKENENILKKVNKSHVTATTRNFQMNDDVNDTMLFRNVIKEIVQWNAKEEHMYNNIFVSNNMNNARQQRDSMSCNIDTEYFDKKLRSQPQNDSVIDRKSICPQHSKSVEELLLSFSFLNNHVSDTISTSKNNVSKNTYKVIPNSTRAYNDQYFQKNQTKPQLMTQTSRKLDISKKHDISILDINKFKPNFVSTPKQRKVNIENKNKHFTNTVGINSKHSNRIKKTKGHMGPRKKLDGKTLKQSSFKARIFNAINTSCTALMNSVTSIFKPNKNLIDPSVKDSTNKSSDKDTELCSYSFTEYMRKRDAAVLGDIPTIQQNCSFERDSCDSCNNTVALKHKMLNDNFLKDTVKKLKVGINTYGCDFKKISKTMWPHEAYMTPAILYNLYRKLIIK